MAAVVAATASDRGSGERRSCAHRGRRLRPLRRRSRPTDERAARRAGTSTASWLLRIAAVLAIVLLGGWNMLLQRQLNTAKAYEQSVAAVLDVAAQPGSRTAILTAAGRQRRVRPGSDQPSGQPSALAMQGLAATTGSTVYTAWAIGGEGSRSRSATSRSEQRDRLARCNQCADGAGVVVAVTLEPGPGATAPSLPIVSRGVATAAG